ARVRTLVGAAGRPIEIRAEVTTPLTELDREIVEQLRNSDAQMVLLDLGLDATMGLRFARYLSEASPTRVFVLTGPAANPEILLEAMRVGASEYLPAPVDDSDLAAALARAVRRVGGAPIREVQEPGHVVAVFSAKGGTGVSTTATNLAVQLHATTHRSTLLLDLDLELGSGALYLGLHPRYSVLDVAKNLHRMDQNLLASFVERHDTGIHVLASPTQPSAGELLTKDQVRSIINLLRRQYEYVVIDLARTVTPLSLGAFEASERILLMTTPDLPTLRNTKRVIPLMERALGGTDKIRLVLNRRRPADIITPEDVKKALGHAVSWSLESDEERVGSSLNEGKPVVLESKSRYGRDIKAMAAALAGPHATNGKPPRRGIAGLLRRNDGRKKEG
ncbi:MAG: AAA family ATPase, partial [Longimicrobiales bacterium]